MDTEAHEAKKQKVRDQAEARQAKRRAWRHEDRVHFFTRTTRHRFHRRVLHRPAPYITVGHPAKRLARLAAPFSKQNKSASSSRLASSRNPARKKARTTVIEQSTRKKERAQSRTRKKARNRAEHEEERARDRAEPASQLAEREKSKKKETKPRRGGNIGHEKIMARGKY